MMNRVIQREERLIRNILGQFRREMTATKRKD
jgi:hypothetical protein